MHSIYSKILGVTETTYALTEIPWGDYLMSPTSKTKRTSYLEIPATFDIETTTIENAERPFAFMYHWQFCLGEHVTFGRTWEEFQHYMETVSNKLQLSSKRRLVVYVHNLPYEFQFMRDFFSITEAFCKAYRKPLKFIANGCFEFRCSYALSNMSLQKFCENEPGVVHGKLTDSFDYSKIRTSETPLTPEEEIYCYNDVKGLAECISARMQEHDLSNIPLTSTGYVRRDFRHAVERNASNRATFLNRKLSPLLYTLCKEEFRGGDTHANLRWSLQILHNVNSVDLGSSYPAAMMYDRYPMTPFIPVSPKRLKSLGSDFAYICRVRFSNLKYVGDTGIPYISISKCLHVSSDRVNDNGRLLFATYADMTVNDIDLKIILHEYTFGDIHMKDLHISKYGYLPDEFKEQLLIYFKAKTELKNQPEHEYEYMKSKNRINSAYGMMVTDIAQDETLYENGEYIQKPVDIEKALQRYYRSRNSFLSYQDGIWVTANARFRLRQGLYRTKEDTVYVDTDSIKYKKDHRADFADLNKEIEALSEQYGAYAYDIYGNKHILGVWEPDGAYEEFKTLGAKKYVVRQDGKYKSTISGVKKTAGAKYFTEHGIDSFANGTTITDSGHLSAYYNDSSIHQITINGTIMTTGSNVALVDKPYTIGVTGEYLDIYQKTLDKIVLN